MTWKLLSYVLSVPQHFLCPESKINRWCLPSSFRPLPFLVYDGAKHEKHKTEEGWLKTREKVSGKWQQEDFRID